MRLLRRLLRIGVLLTLSLLCRVAAAFSLVESPVDGRGIGFGEAWRGGGDACLVTGEDDRRPPGCVELDPRGDDVGLELGNGCLLGGSHVGSKKECLEMLELARTKNVRPWIETMPMCEAGKALAHVKANKARYRYILTQDIN